MGVADRDYWKPQTPGSWYSGSGRLTPVVAWLLVVNVAVFFGDVFVFNNFLAGRDWVKGWGAFTVASGLLGGRVWEMVTFQFLHGGIGHLAVNMIGLYFFGPWLERWWGSRRFVVYYLLCGIGGALFYALLWWVDLIPGLGPNTPLVGASAGLYGILIGVAVIAPDLRVMLVFPPIEMSMRQLALAMLGIAVLAVLTGFDGNACGQAGHLGGAILGYLLMHRQHWLAWAAGRDPNVEIIPPRAFRGPRPEAATDAGLAAEVDRILEKISAHGMHSLTRSERATLDRASQSRNSPP